jgi:hypothetical protein
LSKNSVEQLPLKDQLKQMLEESRVVLPGIQALFGFQLIAVFNQGFGEKLTSAEQRLHLLALGLTALSVAICMAPAALHRQSQPESVSNRLVKLCSTLLTVGMGPLMLGITFDFYLMCRVILKDPQASLWLATALGFVLAALWYLMPYAVRSHLKQPEPERPEFEPTSSSKTYVA